MGILKKLFASFKRRPVRFCILAVIILYALNVGRYLVWPPVGGLARENPGQTSFMEYRQAEWEEVDRKQSIRQKWVSLRNISSSLRKAVVVAEDSTFWQHDGFDLEGMRHALERNVAKGRLAAGGSTITQQLAKNLFFSPRRSVTRKLQEALVAWRLEHSLSKDRILELYLNVVEWGDGVFGAEAAARRYFGVSAAGLSPQQAATLAAMLPAPLRRTPGSRGVQRIAGIILRRMQ